MSQDQVMTESRARIIWGESVASVQAFLVVNGISSSEADARLAEFMLERNRELRRMGVRDLLIGIFMTSLSSAALWMVIHDRYYGNGRAGGLILLAGGYGLWKLWKGIAHLVRPQSEHRSIPDIEE